MARLITQLNRTQGNYQDVFIYTINASFNGISETITQAEIKILFPNFLEIYLGDIQEPIQNVTQESTNEGILYTFDFGSIQDLGMAVRFGIGAMFGPSATNKTSVEITPELWINNILHTTFTSEAIQLSVNPNFRITHEKIVPNINPAPSGVAYYRVLLKNYGDLGGVISNVEISCGCPAGFLIDSSYEIIGNDVSSSEFSDKSQDGTRGIITDNSIQFSLDNFYGEAYAFIYKIIVSENVLIDESYAFNIQWAIADTTQETIIHNTTISTPVYKTNFSLYGPDYSLPEQLINYETSLTNTGNQDLNTLTLTVSLPAEVDFTSCTTGLYQFYGIDETIDMDYQITYETTSGSTGIIGNYNTGVNSIILFSDITLTGENNFLTSLTWEFPTLPVGFYTKSTPLLNGKIRNYVTIGSVIPCQLSLFYLANNISSSNDTTQMTRIQDICILTPTFSSSIGSNPIRPGETFQYTIGVNCRSSRVNTPIFLFLLPNELEYLGNITSSLYDYFKVISNSDIQIPDPIILSDFNENSDTLLAFRFDGDSAIELPQKARLRLSFSVRVRSTSTGDFSSFFLVDSFESAGQVSSSRQSYDDKTELFASYTNSSNNIYAQSSIFTNSILFFVSISSRKEVKGFLDEDFVMQNELARTLAGEEVSYRITLTNTGNATLDSIELIDILPHPKDFGVIETAISRDSQFPIILSTEAITISTLDFDIFYSDSEDPIRFGNNFNTIGTIDNWSTTVPENLNTIRTMKIKTKEQPLLPGESVIILFKTLVPFDVKEGYIAWNSFAADVHYTDTQGISRQLLAVEPDKVGVEIASPDKSKGRISGFVFWDNNKDGLYRSPEQRTPIVNDVGVVLYDKFGTPLRVTFTSDNIDGIPGQYSFSNLELDSYYIRFFIDTRAHVFSKGNGITPLIELRTTQYRDNILAGIHSNVDNKIDILLQVNHSSRQMIRNVLYDQMLIGMKLEDI